MKPSRVGDTGSLAPERIRSSHGARRCAFDAFFAISQAPRHVDPHRSLSDQAAETAAERWASIPLPTPTLVQPRPTVRMAVVRVLLDERVPSDNCYAFTKPQ